MPVVRLRRFQHHNGIFTVCQLGLRRGVPFTSQSGLRNHNNILWKVEPRMCASRPLRVAISSNNPYAAPTTSSTLRLGCRSMKTRQPQYRYTLCGCHGHICYLEEVGIRSVICMLKRKKTYNRHNYIEHPYIEHYVDSNIKW